jgi:hypothetical protein
MKKKTRPKSKSKPEAPSLDEQLENEILRAIVIRPSEKAFLKPKTGKVVYYDHAKTESLVAWGSNRGLPDDLEIIFGKKMGEPGEWVLIGQYERWNDPVLTHMKEWIRSFLTKAKEKVVQHQKGAK